MTALRWYTQPYGSKGFLELVVGPVSNYDGPTLCVAVRREKGAAEPETRAAIDATVTDALIRRLWIQARWDRRRLAREYRAALRTNPNIPSPGPGRIPDWPV